MYISDPWTASTKSVKLVHVSKWRFNLMIKTLLIENRYLFFILNMLFDFIWCTFIMKRVMRTNPSKTRCPEKFYKRQSQTNSSCWCHERRLYVGCVAPKMVSPSSSTIQISLALLLFFFFFLIKKDQFSATVRAGFFLHCHSLMVSKCWRTKTVPPSWTINGYRNPQIRKGSSLTLEMPDGHSKMLMSRRIIIAWLFTKAQE